MYHVAPQKFSLISPNSGRRTKQASKIRSRSVPVYGVAVHAAQNSRLKGGPVDGEVADDVANLGFGNPRALGVLVFHSLNQLQSATQAVSNLCCEGSIGLG